MNPIKQLQEKNIKVLPLIGAVFMILGPLWGYIAMSICKLSDGGAMLDTITFYAMIVGWMMAPVGVLILLYLIMAGWILDARRENAER